jgi:hypothetical protein
VPHGNPGRAREALPESGLQRDRRRREMEKTSELRCKGVSRKQSSAVMEELSLIRFSSGLLDTFSPYLASLTECNFIDMATYDSQCRHWVQNYLLNTTFRGRYPDPYHQIAMAYMRRAEAAFQEYELGRDSLASYVAGRREAVSKYFSSIYHFEQFIAQAYQAYMLLRHLLGESCLYKAGDKSELDRLNQIYNHIKHSDSKLVSGAFPENGTMSTWLTNGGVHCQSAELTCAEAVEILEDIANGANRFGDPEAVLKEPYTENV